MKRKWNLAPRLTLLGTDPPRAAPSACGALCEEEKMKEVKEKKTKTKHKKNKNKE